MSSDSPLAPGVLGSGGTSSDARGLGLIGLDGRERDRERDRDRESRPSEMLKRS